MPSPPSLSITWQMDSPPLSPQSWFAWQGKLAPTKQGPLPSKGGYKILGLDARVPEILEQAFQQGLGRACGWDLTGVEASLAHSCQQAAAVYKRGVSVAGQAPLNSQGHYELRLAPIGPKTQLRELLGLGKKGFLVMDAGLARCWPKLQGQAHLLWEADERRKLLDTVAEFAAEWERQGRPSPWVIVGGGVLADTAGFAASLCGCPFILLPTTLLAAVDACVGGKTGVNAPPFGKNQIGHFAFPAAVVICPDFLQTLPVRQWQAGLAEGVKHAMLSRDLQLMTALQRVAQEKSVAALTPLLLPLIRVKAAIVEADPSEKGQRALLNLGHTLAHALEAYSHAAQRKGDAILLHGEAVALGLWYALLLARQSATISAATCDRLLKALGQSGCILARGTFERYLGASLVDPGLWPKLWAFMLQDKKQPPAAAEVSFVLLTDQDGQGRFAYPIAATAAAACWLQLLESYH